VRLVVVLAVALCACRAKPVDHAAACADAGRNSVDVMLKAARARLDDPRIPADARAQITERTETLDRLAPRQKALVMNRCIDDAWPAPIVSCYMRAVSLDDVRACRAKLSPAQAEKLQHDELALVAGPPVPAGLTPTPMAPRDPRLVQLLTERNELMKQLASGSDEAGAELRAKIDALGIEIKKLEDAAASPLPN
jgi:chorismate mutase